MDDLLLNLTPAQTAQLHTAITLVFSLLLAGGLWLARRAFADKRVREFVERLLPVILASIEERVHKGLDARGEEKLKLAEEAARKVAPQAMASLSSEQFRILAEGTLHSVRPSLAAARASFRPGTAPPLSLPAIPAPARMPSEGTRFLDADVDTHPATPSAKRGAP